jgi:uncharacterized protein (TIGR02996 family)
MPTIAVIVSKAQFEPELKKRSLGLGTVWPVDRYTSQHPSLEALREEGSQLMLFTVRPPNEQLWLVGVLDQPVPQRGAWVAATNQRPIEDLSELRPRISFANGATLSSKPGVLGMALQTPRALSAETVALLSGQRAKTKATRGAEPGPAPTAPEGSVVDEGREWLALWRATKSPRVANLIDALPAPARPPLITGRSAPALAEWKEVEARRDPDDLPRLLATLEQAHSADVTARLKALAKRDDPRVVTRLLAALNEPPFTSQGSRPWWQQVFSMLVASKDPRVGLAFAELGPRYRSIVDTQMGDWASDELSALASTFVAGGRPLTDSERAKVEARELRLFGERRADPAAPTRANKADLDALWEAIVAHVDDDGPRQVFADALLQAGDARGEFITLQLERAGGRATPERLVRERELWVQKGHEFALPLAQVAEFSYSEEPLSREMTFERGFCSAITLQEGSRRFAQLATQPAWGTVKRIAGLATVTQTAINAFLDGPWSRNVLDLSLPARVVDGLRRPHAFTTLALDGHPKNPWQHLPALQSLTIEAPPARFFTGAPASLTDIVLEGAGEAPFDPTPLLSLPSLRSLDLSALSPKPEQLQGLPPLTRLMIQGTFASLLPFLKAVPSLRTVRCSVHSRDEMKFDRTFEKVLAQPGLQVLELCRRVGTLLLHFVRTPTGFRLEAHDWVGLDDLVGLAKRMASFGITQLSVHPARPERDPDLDVDDWQALLAKTWKEVTVISPYTARRST